MFELCAGEVVGVNENYNKNQEMQFIAVRINFDDAHLDFEVKSKLKIRNNEWNKARRWCLGMCPT